MRHSWLGQNAQLRGHWAELERPPWGRGNHHGWAHSRDRVTGRKETSHCNGLPNQWTGVSGSGGYQQINAGNPLWDCREGLGGHRLGGPPQGRKCGRDPRLTGHPPWPARHPGIRRQGHGRAGGPVTRRHSLHRAANVASRCTLRRASACRSRQGSCSRCGCCAGASSLGRSADDHQDHAGHSHVGGHVHAPASFGRAFAIGIGLNVAYVVAEVIYGWGWLPPGLPPGSASAPQGAPTPMGCAAVLSWPHSATPWCCCWSRAASPERRSSAWPRRSRSRASRSRWWPRSASW